MPQSRYTLERQQFHQAFPCSFVQDLRLTLTKNCAKGWMSQRKKDGSMRLTALLERTPRHEEAYFQSKRIE